MKVLIEINTDNAAFEDNGIGNEVLTCLEQFIITAEHRPVPAWNMQLFDSNGNAVGTVKMTE